MSTCSPPPVEYTLVAGGYSGNTPLRKTKWRRSTARVRIIIRIVPSLFFGLAHLPSFSLTFVELPVPGIFVPELLQISYTYKSLNCTENPFYSQPFSSGLRFPKFSWNLLSSDLQNLSKFTTRNTYIVSQSPTHNPVPRSPNSYIPCLQMPTLTFSSSNPPSTVPKNVSQRNLRNVKF